MLTELVAPRSTRPEVRNPLLQLPAAKRLGEWLEPNTAQLLAALLEDLARDCSVRARESWRRHKAPMALYWKICAVYSRHLARVCRAVQRQAEQEASQ